MEDSIDARIKTMMSAISTLIALQVATLAIIVGGTWYLYTDLKQHVTTIASGAGPSVPANVEQWHVLEREHNAFQGAMEAEVVVIEFSDFQCPFCAQFTERTRPTILDEYGDTVRMVFKHFPLEQIHPQAMAAAIAAQCARREGKFWEAHEQLFGQPNDLGVDSLLRLGDALHLSDSYVDCVINEETRAEVEQDLGDGRTIGIQGTPTFLINGKVLVGSQSMASFRSALEQAGLREPLASSQ